MKNIKAIRALVWCVGVMMWCCVPAVIWGVAPATNLACPAGTYGPSCSSCPTTTSAAGPGCAWVKIVAGPMRPGSSVKLALFRMGENQLSEAVYSPQTLNFVAGYAMKGVSHEVTAAGAPRQVTLIQSAGVPFLFNFKDNESIGVPVFGDAQIKKCRLFMVDANGWTVLKEPAYYDLYTGDGERYRFNAYKTSPQYMQMVSHRTVAGREETYQDMGVEVIRDSSQSLRQVLLPTRLADIVVTDSSRYALKFYTLASMVGGKDTNGYYRIDAGAVPFETWSFANPLPGTLRKLIVTRSMAGRTTVYDFTYNPDAEDWIMTSGDGLDVARQEEDATMWNDARTERWVTHSVKAADGTLVSRYVEQIKSFGWGDGVTRRITETGGVNQTNLFTYTAAGLTESAIDPDGSWRWHRYDAAGRVTNELSAIKDSSLTSSVTAAHAVLTSYAPVDLADSPRLNDQLPRMVTESILGTVVARTYRGYRQGGNGELQEIVEKATTPAAAYGDTNNLRTVTTYYGTNTVNCQIGRVATVAYPDGRMDTFTYEYGTYQPGVGEIPPSFEANPAGTFWRETVVHGTAISPEGIAGKTTKETRILDPMSQEVLDETWVCVGGPNYERVAWTSKGFDEWQHPVLVRNAKGEKSEASWGGNCCGKEWEIGGDGTMFLYGYDLLGKLTTIIRKGATTNEADRITSYTLDSEGRRLTETLSAGPLTQLVSSNTYDLAGRLISSLDSQCIVTTYRYEGVASTTIRGGVTNATTRYLDGQAKSITENEIVKTAYDSGIDASGFRWTKSFSGPAGTNSPAWQKTTTDMMGRPVKTEKPGYGGAVVATTYSYNTKGQLISTTQQPNNSTTLYQYNELGEQTRSGLDVNTNGVLDLAGPDRVNESATWYEQDGSGDYWQCRASILYAGNASATPITNSIQKIRLTGLGVSSDSCLLTSESCSFDLLGNQTTSRTYVDRTAKTLTQTVIYPDSTDAATQVTINGQLSSSTSKTGVQTAYTYDALGRQIVSLNPEPRTLGSYTTYNSLGQVTSTMDAASNRTSFVFDDLGRRIQVTDPLTNSTFTAYDDEGHVLATWGATYPVSYDYDDFGRMTAMYTLRDSSLVISNYSSFITHTSSFDRTCWVYDEATGLLTNKLYADGHGPSYTYTPDGKLATRTWARGVVTAYSYDSLGQLTNISYSDNTPGVTFGFDRLGRQTTITDGTGTRLFSYTDAFQLASETNAAAELVRIYDSQGRPVGYDLVMAGSTSVVSSIRYSHDELGRFRQVDADLRAASLPFQNFRYGYLAGSDLNESLNETNTGYGVRRSFEPNRNLLTQILNASGTNRISQFDYANDAVGRRTQRVDSSSLTNNFGYNSRSELVEALMGINNFSYRYDPIGNRTVATNNGAVTEYLANSLNQYFVISNQQSQIAPAYDLDGNLTNDGCFAFAWDAENRMTGASNEAVVANYSYDYMSRRYRKIVSGVTNNFVYDGWNLIQETSSAGVTNTYVWGLDLSGTQQGAGGIGGLLSVMRNGTAYFPCYDANGNISEYVDASGAVVAHREYDAYGNTVASSGQMVNDFNFWFSSKYLDQETGLYYYGHRYYSPEIGRWASRDPIHEMAFGLRNARLAMLYTHMPTVRVPHEMMFVRNMPTSFYDLLGLCDTSCHDDSLTTILNFAFTVSHVTSLNISYMHVDQRSICGIDCGNCKGCGRRGTITASDSGAFSGSNTILVPVIGNVDLFYGFDIGKSKTTQFNTCEHYSKTDTCNTLNLAGGAAKCLDLYFWRFCLTITFSYSEMECKGTSSSSTSTVISYTQCTGAGPFAVCHDIPLW